MTYSQIHVRFVEAGSGRVLTETNLPAESLPETFVLGKTALTIRSQLWTVVQADPVTRDGFLQTGQLTLTLEQPATQTPAPVTNIPAKDILYPMPTICDAIPETGAPGDNEGTGYLLHEDDWRQVELVSAQYERAIDAEMADIEAIVRDHSVKIDEGRAYKQIFIRQRIKAPIASPVPMSDIKAALPENSWTFGGVGFEKSAPAAGSGALIPNSFAFDLRVCVIYGQMVDGAAAVFGLKFGAGAYGDSAVVAAFLDRLISAHSLVLVDWYWRRKIGGGASAINSYLQKKIAEK